MGNVRPKVRVAHRFGLIKVALTGALWPVSLPGWEVLFVAADIAVAWLVWPCIKWSTEVFFGGYFSSPCWG